MWTSGPVRNVQVMNHPYIFISHNDAFTKWTNLIKSPAPWSPSYLMTTLSTFVIRTDLHIQKHAICSKSAAGLLPCCHQADIRMRSHRLLRLDDNKSATSCQQVWCKLIVKTFFHKLDDSCFNNLQQVCCRLVTLLSSSRYQDAFASLVLAWW